MTLAYTLSMPNNNSWNGRWSGDGYLYVRCRTYRVGKTGNILAANALGHDSYRYDFGDGWAASVSVREVDSKEAARLRRMSRGFCGYEWMIDSIERFGEILSTQQQEEYRRLEGLAELELAARGD